MIHYLFAVQDKKKIPEAKKFLTTLKVQDLYFIQDEMTSGIVIGGFAFNTIDVAKLPSFLTLQDQTLAEINWEDQWRLFAPVNEEGVMDLNLSSYKDQALPIKLKSGAGFGNLSHPTTRLMLKLLAQHHLENTQVIDVGSGSGILSFAAHRFGASKVIGIDIDPRAVEHSIENLNFNDLSQDKITFQVHLEKQDLIHEEGLILMNMIRSEQQMAWSQNGILHHYGDTLITSGILEEEKDVYLKMVEDWGWKLGLCIEEEGWLGFVFHRQ